jgi:hypothetical protein
MYAVISVFKILVARQGEDIFVYTGCLFSNLIVEDPERVLAYVEDYRADLYTALASLYFLNIPV